MIITNQEVNGRIDELREKLSVRQCICIRCGGFLVNDTSGDFWDRTNELERGARRCVQCGDVIDAVILRNRRTRLVSGSLSSTATPASSLGPQAAT